MHKKQEKMRLNFPKWLLLSVILLPFLAYGADGQDHFSLLSWLGLKDNHIHDVATKIATLHEDNDIWGLDFSPDGKHLAATALLSEKIHIWDWRNDRIIQTLIKPQFVPDATIRVPLRYSPDGRWLAACHGFHRLPNGSSMDTTIWDTQSWEIAHAVEDSVPGGCEGVGFTPDGKFFLRAVNRADNSIIAYRTGTWAPAWGLATFPLYPNTLVVSPDGKFIAVGGDEIFPYKPGQPDKPIRPQILIVDVGKRQVIQTINPFPAPDPRTHYGLDSLAWDPDGVHLAAGTEFGQANAGEDAVQIFDVRTGKQIAHEPATTTKVLGLVYTPDGKYLIESAIDHTIRIWDGQHQHLLQSIKAEAASLAVTSDSRYLAMGGDRKILIWALK